MSSVKPATTKSHVTRPVLSPYIPAFSSSDGSKTAARPLFPLSRDHLIPLIEFNIYRASITNMTILGLFSLTSGCSCQYASLTLFPTPPPADETAIPDSLKPTPMQLATPHEPWIDILPSGRMRDNAIMRSHTFTNEEFCKDILGGMCGGKPGGLDGGLVVWSNPWEPSGWELTEGFARKWSFLLEGCEDMFVATNRWRAMRHEEPLVFWEVN